MNRLSPAKADRRARLLELYQRDLWSDFRLLDRDDPIRDECLHLWYCGVLGRNPDIPFNETPADRVVLCLELL